MVQVLANLDMEIYEDKEIVVARNSYMSDMILVQEGGLHLYGFFKNSDKQTVKIKMLRLPKYSWYGDFPILLEIPSNF